MMATFLNCPFVLSQENLYNWQGQPTTPTVDSPQVWSMIRYGDSSVALNLGAPYVKIPIIETDDPDFDLNLSVVYTSQGFRPWTPDNYVGMGWHIEGLGVIHREIHGVPDDICNLYGEHVGIGATNSIVSGLRAGLQANPDSLHMALERADTSWILSHVLNATMGMNEVMACPIEKTTQTEICPDLYRFRFGQHSGKFVINYDGRVILVSDNGGRYRIDLSGYNLKERNSQEQTVISITDDDGKCFSFGGGYDAQEYTAFSWTDFASSTYSSPTHNDNYIAFQSSLLKQFNRTTAYMLSKVKAVNGREMDVQYLDEVPRALHTSPGRIITDSRNSITINPNARKSYSIVPSWSPDRTLCNDMQINYALIKTAFVSEVRTDDKRIVFHYSRRDNPFFSNPDQDNWGEYDFVRSCGAVLDSVVLFSRINGKRLEKTEFEYATVSGRILLTGIKNNKRGRFNFAYYPSLYGYSIATTADIDKWGFWSGEHFNTSILNNLPDSRLNQLTMNFPKNTSDINREPSLLDYKAFMLKEIIYPTGGTLSYDYEPHDYSEYYSQEYSHDYRSNIYGTLSPRKLSGGARVMSERFSSPGTEDVPRVHLFDYQEDKKTSSGRLLKEGDYYLRGFFFPKEGYMLGYPATSQAVSCYAGWGDGLSRNNGVGDYIEYGMITEYDYCEPGLSACQDSIDFYRKHSNLGEPDISDSFEIDIRDINSGTYWIMTGGAAQILIKSSITGDLIYSHSFINSDTPITIQPLQYLPHETCQVDIHIESGGYLNIETHCKIQNAELKGKPRKVTTFSKTPAYNNNGMVIFREPITEADDIRWMRHKGQHSMMRYWFIPIDWSHVAGKIISVDWYDSNGETVHSIKNEYFEQDLGDSFYVWSHPVVKNVYVPFINIGNIVRMPLRRYLLSQAVENVYGHSGEIMQTITNYTYDNDGYLTGISFKNARGATQEYSYRHPHHFSDSIMTVLTANNILSPIVKEVHTSDGEEIYIASTQYKRFPSVSVPLPYSVARAHTSAPEESIRYLDYDTYGNPICTTADGLNRVILWSYLGKYPVAIIENATISEVKQALHIDDINIISSSPTYVDAIDSLRDSLSNALVNTYRYNPGIGIIEHTLPDATKTYYEYDIAGRLEEIYTNDKNGNKSIRETYTYHLVNE